MNKKLLIVLTTIFVLSAGIVVAQQMEWGLCVQISSNGINSCQPVSMANPLPVTL